MALQGMKYIPMGLGFSIASLRALCPEHPETKVAFLPFRPREFSREFPQKARGPEPEPDFPPPLPKGLGFRGLGFRGLGFRV